MIDEHTKRIVLHEIGNEFNKNDNTGGIYDYNYINNPFALDFDFNQAKRCYKIKHRVTRYLIHINIFQKR